MATTLFCRLICTSFNEKTYENGKKLELRGEWIEECQNADRLTELANLWQIDLTTFKYPSNGTISEILEGKMLIGVPIHIRIVRF